MAFENLYSTFLDHLPSIRTAFDWLLAIMALMTAVLYTYRIRKNDLAPEAVIIALGVIFVAIGISTNKLFWGTQRALSYLYPNFAATMREEWSAFLLIPIMIGVLGYGLHLKYNLQQWFGNRWLIHFFVISSISIVVFQYILHSLGV